MFSEVSRCFREIIQSLLWKRRKDSHACFQWSILLGPGVLIFQILLPRHGDGTEGLTFRLRQKIKLDDSDAPSNTKVAASSFQSLLIFKDWRTRPADLVNSRGTKHILVFQVATVTCAWPLSYRSRSVLETVQSPIWIQDCQYYYSLRI